MEENVQQPSLLSHAVRSGAILGGISVILYLILYLIDPALLASSWLRFIVLILIVGLVVVFGIQYRNLTTGYMTFGNAYKHGLFTFIIAGLIGVLFNFLLFNVIDPGLKDYLLEVSVENAESMARSFGFDEATTDEMVNRTRENVESSYTMIGQITTFGIALIIYLVLSLITGAIVKKRNPEEEI